MGGVRPPGYTDSEYPKISYFDWLGGVNIVNRGCRRICRLKILETDLENGPYIDTRNEEKSNRQIKALRSAWLPNHSIGKMS